MTLRFVLLCAGLVLLSLAILAVVAYVAIPRWALL